MYVCAHVHICVVCTHGYSGDVASHYLNRQEQNLLSIPLAVRRAVGWQLLIYGLFPALNSGVSGGRQPHRELLEGEDGFPLSERLTGPWPSEALRKLGRGHRSPKDPVDVTSGGGQQPSDQAQGHRVNTLFYPLASVSTYSLFSLPRLLPASPLLLLPLPLLLKDRMENKAMYLNTVSDRDTGSIFEEPFDGRSLSKLNLCEDGECLRLGPGGEICPGPHTQPGHCPRCGDLLPNTAHGELHALKGRFQVSSHSYISTTLCHRQDEELCYR